MASHNRDTINRVSTSNINTIGAQIIKEIVIPELTKEVNENKNFAQLRQVYNSLILATWYKKKIKDSILAQVYADQKKVVGVGYNSSVIPSSHSGVIASPKGEAIFKKATHIKRLAVPHMFAGNDTELIYHRYLQAFKKGVYNYIKEDIDPLTNQAIARKYFSGGMFLKLRFGTFAMKVKRIVNRAELGNTTGLIDVSSQVVVPRSKGFKDGVTNGAMLGNKEFWSGLYAFTNQASPRLNWDISGLTKDQLKAELKKFVTPDIRKYLDRFGISTTDFLTDDTQRLKNLWRLAHLAYLYFESAQYKEKEDESFSLISALQSSGFLRKLFESPDDATFTDRVQGVVAMAYVEDFSRISYPSTERFRHAVNGMLLNLGDLNQAVSRQIPLLLLFLAMEGHIDGYPQWDGQFGWRGHGVKLYDLLVDDIRRDENLQKLFTSEDGAFNTAYVYSTREIALWQIVYHSRNYTEVREALEDLSEKGYLWRGGAENAEELLASLNVFGRDPSKVVKTGEDLPIWFSRRSDYDLTRRAATEFSGKINRLVKDADVSRKIHSILQAIYEFDSVVNPSDYEVQNPPPHSIRSVFLNIGREHLLDNIPQNNDRLMTMIYQMWLYLNTQIVPAGYFIQMDFSNQSGRFDLHNAAGGPIVGRRFVQTDDGREFEQVFVDAKSTPGYYHRDQVNIRIRITHILQEIDGRSKRVMNERVTGVSHLDDEFTAQFVPVFMQDAKEFSTITAEPLDKVSVLIADHEARHGLDRHITGSRKYLTLMHTLHALPESNF